MSLLRSLCAGLAVFLGGFFAAADTAVAERVTPERAAGGWNAPVVLAQSRGLQRLGRYGVWELFLSPRPNRICGLMTSERGEWLHVDALGRSPNATIVTHYSRRFPRLSPGGRVDARISMRGARLGRDRILRVTGTIAEVRSTDVSGVRVILDQSEREALARADRLVVAVDELDYRSRPVVLEGVRDGLRAIDSCLRGGI